MPCPSTSMAIDVRWGRGPMKVLSERWVWDTYFCILLVPSSQFYACFQVFHFYPTVNFCWAYLILGFLGGSNSKESAWNVGNPGSIPGSERSPKEGNGNPFQYSCLENSMDRGALAYSSWGCKESDTTEQLTLSYLILWLCRSDKSQLMRSNSSQIVTYCLMIKVFIFRVPVACQELLSECVILPCSRHDFALEPCVLSHLVVFDSLWPQGLQFTRLLCTWDLGIFQERILAWIAMSSSRGSS